MKIRGVPLKNVIRGPCGPVLSDMFTSLLSQFRPAFPYDRRSK
jgi:hypothetical protein